MEILPPRRLFVAAARLRRRASGVLALGLSLACPATAVAETVIAPVGGRPINLGSKRVICPDQGELGGWKLEGQGTLLRPPAAVAPASAPGPRAAAAAAATATSASRAATPTAATAAVSAATTAAASDVHRAWVRVASRASACAEDGRRLDLVAYRAPWPSLEDGMARIYVDLGRMEVTGRHLEGAVVSWRGGGQKGVETCREVHASPRGGDLQICQVPVDLREAATAAARDSWAITLLPPGTPADEAMVAFDARGATVDLAGHRRQVGDLILSRLLPNDAAVEVRGDGGSLSLVHPEAVAAVRCEEVACSLVSGEVVVHSPPREMDSLELRLQLVPHVLWGGAPVSSLSVVGSGGSGGSVMAVVGAAGSAEATFRIPIQRCPLTWASVPPLRGVASQLTVVRLGSGCRQPASLVFQIGGQSVRPQDSLHDDNDLLVVLPLPRPPGDEVAVTALRGAEVVGAARIRSQALPSLRLRLELPGLGPIDFLPTNRPVRALLPPLSAGGQLVPVAQPGIYEVTHAVDGRIFLRAADEASGQVPIRLVYRDRSLPPTLRTVTLAELDDSTDRSIKEAHVPVALGGGEQPVAELICTGADGRARALVPGVVNKVAFQARDSCRLVLHRARLPVEAGEQKLRVAVSVQAMDGASRNEAAVDQRLMLRPGSEPRQVFVRGATASFDRVVVRVAQEDDDAHYSVRLEESLGLPALQWTVVMGASRWRLSATTAFPTGLFRVSAHDHSGILSLNSGVVLRLLSLGDDGRAWPVALELGTLWLNIAGDTTSSRVGQAGLVAGLGFGVPIANLGRATQATVSIHAWAEYEVSRLFLPNAGSPWGFVFGPSLFIGDVGFNF